MTTTAKFLNLSDLTTLYFKGGTKNISDNDDQNLNVYQKIIRNQNSSRSFMLRFYQVIPKYYLISKDLRKIILSYSTGSGKSATSVFIASHFFDIIKKNKFLVQFGLLDKAPKTNIQVIGSWVTENAFILDLLRPEFGLITTDEIDEINSKRNSPYKEVREEGEKLYSDLKRTLTKTFNFCNFQSVFNKCFPNLSQQKYIQNIDSLFTGYRNKDIKPNETYLESLRNSIIIVDEFQHMYSTDGMNTFGFVIGLMMKYASKYNYRFVFLSATMINNSLAELPELMSILNENDFIDVKKYIQDQEIDLGENDKLTIKTLRDDKEEEIIDNLKNIFLYYNQKKASNLNTNFKISDIEITSKQNYKDNISKIFSESEDKFRKIFNIETKQENRSLNILSIISNDESLPIERHIGNIIINNKSNKNSNPMCLYTLQSEGIQDQKYSETIKNETLSDMAVDEDEVDEQRYNYHDGFIPSDKGRKEQGIITGDVLNIHNIKNYSAYGYEIIKLCIENTLRGEKTVIYHDKITNFGLKQYIEILKFNGFIQYGTIPKPNTLCTICGKQMSTHTNTDHQFIPMRYAALFGDLSQKERHDLTSVYNDANNLYGELINVIFISKIAASGLSFYNTNNLIILSRISNISLWKQICGRVVRTKSHALLPKEKRFVNIYTFCLQSSKEQLKSCYDIKYYTLRSILNEQINNFTDKLSSCCISNTLFNHPEKMGPSTPTELLLFNNDINTEMNFIFKELDMKKTLPWKLNTLMKRIRDIDFPLSFIDFNTISDDDLISHIVQKHFIRLERFKSDDEKEIYCIPYKSIITKQFDKILTSFNFKDLDYITIDDNHIKKNISELSTIEHIPDNIRLIRIMLTKLIKMTNYKIHLYKDSEAFWDAIYFIHDEYYSDDRINFINNHCTKGRNKQNIAGFYCNNMIIMKDGSIETINKSKEVKNSFNGMPYGFKITSFHSLDSSSWFLQVVISENLKEVSDKRKQMRGVCCNSFDVMKLKNYILDIDYTSSRKNICWGLIEKICDLAISTNQTDKLLTPY